MSYCIMLAFWLLLCGNLHWESIALGLVALILRAVLGKAWCTKVRRFGARMGLLRTALLFLLCFLKELCTANLAMLRVIWGKGCRGRGPSAMHSLKDGLCLASTRVVLANAISLTPGTLTVQLGQEELLIHTLHEGFAQGLEDCALQNRLRRMEAEFDELLC